MGVNWDTDGPFSVYFSMKGNFLTLTASARPLDPGPVVLTATGKQYTLKGRCTCTSPLLHYVIVDETGNEIVAQHSELSVLLSSKL